MPVQRIGPHDHYTLWGSALFGCPCTSQYRPHGSPHASRGGLPFVSLPIWSFMDDSKRPMPDYVRFKPVRFVILASSVTERRVIRLSHSPIFPFTYARYRQVGWVRPQVSKKTCARRTVCHSRRHPRSDGRETGNVPSRFRSPAPVGLQSGKVVASTTRNVVAHQQPSRSSRGVHRTRNLSAPQAPPVISALSRHGTFRRHRRTSTPRYGTAPAASPHPSNHTTERHANHEHHHHHDRKQSPASQERANRPDAPDGRTRPRRMVRPGRTNAHAFRTA